MKAIQITMDERLLERLDADAEVQRLGRSAVIRKAADQYLRRRRRQEVAAGYEQAYGTGGGLGVEWAGWEEEGTWPPEP
jgi:metal-responsive CopG/Arc/MetJ family transcriptional regulator